MPAESLLGELEHLRKWPPEHWHLAFQGQLRTVSDADAAPASASGSGRQRAQRHRSG